MMRITGLPPIPPRERERAETGSGFSLPGARADGTAGSSPTTPAPSVAMLVALSVADEEREHRRRMAEHATKGLDVLEELTRDGEEPGSDGIEALSAWASNAGTPDDPALASIQRDIELRVRVELAKRGG